MIISSCARQIGCSKEHEQSLCLRLFVTVNFNVNVPTVHFINHSPAGETVLSRYLALKCTKLPESFHLLMRETWYVFGIEEILNSSENFK
jgi:hypothetical protein